ncbi:hypothetical protein M3205_03600 [Cytobacillus firmus]|uniref:hypothetical protein n=1 Tax=Cytobacillus firmus TaxID=1399 RepID=UPI00203BA58C|nr:hypothetical protein [Cytobacillus firmus]MCM3704802.1 hypothetical protein [Cytobacillus firmus]
MDTELTILRPDESISPQSLSRKTRIPYPIIEDILSSLVFESSLGVSFIIFCTNDDPDLVHAFEFPDKKLLRDFIVNNKFTCPDCDSQLNTKNIRVAFIKKDIPVSV